MPRNLVGNVTKAVIAMRSVRAKKSLGQHFLKDLDVAERIASTLEEFDLPILEVGPGMGVLSQFLFVRYPQVKLVEVDGESVDYLRAEYPELGEDLIHGDFLQMDPTKLFSDQFMVIGNYPYNISSQIFFKILEYKDRIPAVSGMLQKEVALRLASGPGGRDYGILSVLLQAWYDIVYLFTVDAQLFSPPPKVQSGVIKLVRNDRQELGCDPDLFKQVIKTTFNQRRKTLRNSIKPLLRERADGLPEHFLRRRPEELSVEEFVELTLLVQNIRAEE